MARRTGSNGQNPLRYGPRQYRLFIYQQVPALGDQLFSCHAALSLQLIQSDAMHVGNTGSGVGSIATVPQLEKQQVMLGQILNGFFGALVSVSVISSSSCLGH